MQNAQSHTASISKVGKLLPQWFAFLVTLTYATGFLCVFTFLDRYGIRDTGEDFFRVKYIHVGILYLLFPLSILLPSSLIISLKHTERKEKERLDKEAKEKESKNKASEEKHQQIEKTEVVTASSKTTQVTDQVKETPPRFHIPISGLVLFFNMLVVFYLYILFVPRDFAFSKALVIPLIFATSILGPFLIERFVDWCIKHEKSQLFLVGLRWCLVALVVCVLDYMAFSGFVPSLWKIFWGSNWYPEGGIYYVLFMLLIPYILWRANDKVKTAPNDRSKREIYLASTAVVAMFYFLGIIAFALRVYPAIPIAKGGGNYTESPRMQIVFKPQQNHTNGISSAEALISASGRFIMIEKNQTSVYLANADEAGGPEKWREMRQLPNVIEVRRDIIDFITYNQVSTTNANNK